MPPKGGGGGDKSKQFFDGIQSQKQDAIRWCLNYGGISSATRDEDGYSGLHRAAMLGKPRSLETILDHIRRAHMSMGGGDIRAPKTDKRRKPCGDLEEKDEEKGMTALMHACAKGAFDCVRLLHECNCSWEKKSDEGKNALEYAKLNKKEDILAWAARGFEDIEEEEEDDNMEEIEGETATERRKRIKTLKAGGDKLSFATKKANEDDDDDKDDDEEKKIGPGPAPKWDEIIACRSSGNADLAISRLGDEKAIDPSLWYCRHVNNLKIRMPPGVLTKLPSELSHLKSLTTLIVSNNSLKEFPAEILKLEHLKNLEFTDNQVERFPEDMDDLENLEVIDACRNKLESTEPLKGLANLVTLKLDQNKIKGLSLAYKKLTRLQTLSASHNEISSLDEKMGRLGALTSLNLSNNSIKELPTELANLSEKVLHHLNLDENPLKDSKVKKILEKGRAPIKELIAHLEKEAKGGKSKKNKSKNDDDDEEEDEQEEKEEEAEPEPKPVAAAAPAPAGGGGGGGKNKKKGKGGGGKGGGGGGMSEAQKEAARAEAMRKLGMPVPAPKAAAAAAPPPPAAEETEEEADADFEAGDEADDDDLLAYMQDGGDSDVDSEEEFDDFLSDDKPKESSEDRQARIKRELEARNKGAIALQKEQEKKKREHEEWLESMSPEMRTLYIADQQRKQRQAEEETRSAEQERDQRRQEEMRRKAGGGASAAPAAAGKPTNEKTESKWTYSGDKLVKEVLERKGPKKPVREIQLHVPNRKVGLIIGKGGVNIKIIEAKSAAKVKIFKPAPGDQTPDTLVTVKGSPENVDRACETINQVFAQAKAHRVASKQSK